MILEIDNKLALRRDQFALVLFREIDLLDRTGRTIELDGHPVGLDLTLGLVAALFARLANMHFLGELFF